jgi:hypothetical protein
MIIGGAEPCENGSAAFEIPADQGRCEHLEPQLAAQVQVFQISTGDLAEPGPLLFEGQLGLELGGDPVRRQTAPCGIEERQVKRDDRCLVPPAQGVDGQADGQGAARCHWGTWAMTASREMSSP